jgi:hypothetical protein
MATNGILLGADVHVLFDSMRGSFKAVKVSRLENSANIRVVN